MKRITERQTLEAEAARMSDWRVLIPLKIAMLRRGVRQTRMAVDLGWDPAKLSRIVNGLTVPSSKEREAIANYLRGRVGDLFSVRPSNRNDEEGERKTNTRKVPA